MGKLSGLLAAFCVLAFGAGLLQQHQATTEETFRAKVVECRTGSVVVEPLSDELGDRVSFGTADLEQIGAAVGDTVEITFDGLVQERDPAGITASSWRLVEKAETPPLEETPDATPQTVGAMTLLLPADWVCTPEQQNQSEGLRCHPADTSGFSVYFGCYEQPIGLCGTGVDITEREFASGLRGTCYTEQIEKTMWMMLIFDTDAGNYTAECQVPCSLWQTYQQQLDDILQTVTIEA